MNYTDRQPTWSSRNGCSENDSTTGVTVTAAPAWNRGDDAGGLACRGPLAGSAPA